MGLKEDEFNETLTSLGIKIGHGAKRLPKGAVTKLKSEARKRRVIELEKTRSTPVEQAKTKIETKSKVKKDTSQNLSWRIIGKERSTLKMIDEDQLMKIHYALVEDFKNDGNPIEPAGVKNANMLSSALLRPHTSLGSDLKYPTVEMAAAALLHSLALNHPFHNGNKRTALVAMLVFLDENGLLLTCDEDELFKLVLLTTQHRLLDYDQKSALYDFEVLHIARWIQRNSRNMERGDRAISWRRLKGILGQNGCEIDSIKPGNKINITRTLIVKGPWRSHRTKTLHTQVSYESDGREAEANTIKKIRKDLHLDEDNGGMDSAAFYEAAPFSPDDFIVKYRQILRRLARL